MALGSTQPRTEISTRNVLGGKGRPALRANNLTATTLWASTARYRDTFTYLLCIKNWDKRSLLDTWAFHFYEEMV
jgi:hypothetical protein